MLSMAMQLLLERALNPSTRGASILQLHRGSSSRRSVSASLPSAHVTVNTRLILGSLGLKDKALNTRFILGSLGLKDKALNTRFILGSLALKTRC